MYYFYNQAPCPPGTKPYMIMAGDTYYRLAIRYGTTVDAIIAANPNVNPDMLMIGQRICIPTTTPPPVTCPSGTTPYTIRAGDTFYNIARRQNISLDALLAANPGVDPDRLQIGQVICLPTTPPPPPTGCPTLRRGSRGEWVRKAQRILADANFDPGPIDGIFGPLTETAVREFQRSKGLTVDGIIGPRTWAAMGVDCTTPPIPPTPTCPSGTTPYTIRSGDTFFNLAARYNTTVDAIRRANPGVDPDRLQIGQIICIPTS